MRYDCCLLRHAFLLLALGVLVEVVRKLAGSWCCLGSPLMSGDLVKASVYMKLPRTSAFAEFVVTWRQIVDFLAVEAALVLLGELGSAVVWLVLIAFCRWVAVVGCRVVSRRLDL